VYVPPPFREDRQDILVAAIRARSFGTLITALDGAIQISHIPFLCVITEGRPELIAHLARQNPQARSLGDGADAVASFLLDEAYISPRWYPLKQETGRVVPTWNYIAVEARGPAELIDDPADVLAIVDALTARHETGRTAPWSSADAPADYITALLKGIVGLRLRVHRLTGAWKLDQHKREIDRRGAAAGLRDDDGKLQMAEFMENPRWAAPQDQG
jgi:transcriptional regulator